MTCQACSKKLVLLLHGNSGTSRDMKALEDLFSTAGYTVINPDLPLHGSNRKFKAALTIANCADHFRDMLLSHPDSELSIIGFSDGANIALRLLQLQIPKITTVVLVSPNSSAREVLPVWRIIFMIARLTLALVLYIPVFRRCFRRIGMMTRYHLDLHFPHIPEKTILLYAAKDMISKQDQHRIAASLGREARIVPGTNHLTILKSDYLQKMLTEEIL